MSGAMAGVVWDIVEKFQFEHSRLLGSKGKAYLKSILQYLKPFFIERVMKEIYSMKYSWVCFLRGLKSIGVIIRGKLVYNIFSRSGGVETTQDFSLLASSQALQIEYVMVPYRAYKVYKEDTFLEEFIWEKQIGLELSVLGCQHPQ
ncbi:hypothetical protein HPP92_016839 [Vanilla planifolia]|uniref:Uncharacterized protein n=1 Tax=Vanilla planifolia TaxID=51239 RepID=A0A835UNU5_VANPL|nr:hypothetical protein HPP92_016839 [Vanilla planifolia]